MRWRARALEKGLQALDKQSPKPKRPATKIKEVEHARSSRKYTWAPSLVTPEPYFDGETYWINFRAESYSSETVEKVYICVDCKLELDREPTGPIPEGRHPHYCPGV